MGTTPTKRAYLKWDNTDGIDFLQIMSPSGAILGWIDNNGSLQGTLPTYKTTTTIVTSAQLKAMPATKVTVVPAQGANTVIVPQALTAQYKFLTTAYTLGNADNALSAVYTGQSVSLSFGIPTLGLADQTANAVGWQSWAGGILCQPQSTIANKGLDLTLTGTTPSLTIGDGTVVVTTIYAVIAMQ